MRIGARHRTLRKCNLLAAARPRTSMNARYPKHTSRSWRHGVRPRPRALAIAAASIFLGSACAQRPVNPPLKGHEKNAAYEFEHLERNRGKQDDLVDPRVLGRRHARRRVLVRRARGAAAHRGHRELGRALSAARRGRSDHRRLGRQLHRARVRPLWREDLRRLRAALPEARRPGRAHQTHRRIR